ncbi:CDGSH iron-sulfur domain-containing protein [Paracoccus tegillarcae]|uniref:Iron-binding protein n=1 Tax=Paracoccus tegillarcae TaxID=1529068 RepID=A0A2K9F5U2_9RHOB|nr:CDGSH iron-sulfur domain-containing protein [Paracoccus tegillarcae]AUH34551.1 iron-binding protein [Paracoccus tegillarcae]
MPPAQSDTITVHFDGRKCIHARRCVLGLPAVFRPGTKGGWIFPDQAQAEEIARVIDACPSGALTYERKDGGLAETLPKVNVMRPWEDGPNELRGDIRIDGQDPRKRALLCRCGQSQNMPFCDNSHQDANFAATAALATADDKLAELDARDGPLTIKPTKNGPLMVSGNLEIIAGSGRPVATGTKFFLCRCGHSKNKPYCDGSHTKAGFEAE